MKKMFFLAATAALALSSCTSDELAQEQPSVEDGAVDGAVSFAAYSGRATRTNNDATVALAKDGFGVFAYEQGISDWATYVTSYNVPNFMFNQQVDAFKSLTLNLKSSIDATEYAALSTTYKGFYEDANGEGNHAAKSSWTKPTTSAEYAALPAGDKAVITDNGSDVTLAWTYAPVKYFSNVPAAKHSFFAYGPWKSDVNVKFSSTGPKIHYSMDNPYDLLWGHKSSDVGETYTTYKDETKASVGVSNKLGFTFMHMLAQINVDLSYFSDNVHNDSHEYASGTSATLEEGTKIIVRSVKLVGSIASEGDLDLATGEWTYTNVDESAFEVSNIIFDHNSAPDNYQSVFDHLQILPPMTGNTVEIQVVYDVETIDESDRTGLNSHVVTNTWKSGPITFLQGNAYDYKLHLGMTSVKFDASVNANWDEGTPTIVDLPNTNYTSSSNRR